MALYSSAKGKPIKSKTLGQKSYVEAIKNNTITFGVIVAFIPITYSMIQLVHNYNVLSTRKLPQYNYEGGDHNVL